MYYHTLKECMTNIITRGPTYYKQNLTHSKNKFEAWKFNDIYL